ncbi:4Fe-4S dicluster domain-containing protein [Capillimicrobium parvum]|uniref:Ion-translocating oxidoreductase complex subunit B n=1 Tax=Capillimicrobium parvum TaxID=2884022 RepID=A0A9E6Y2A8_9ACTN|nr:4Fe-4S dicluster domain-containing protein [Capillimicrobium parvum]UGS38553.1 Ion-translocating oxidoreductase complex subunit B [Capillimicrobium parvum]
MAVDTSTGTGTKRQYGFAIDHRSCIGCHACTVACKTEHGVELGVFRTWVKYIERGEFPDTRRYFSVLRCNHCTDAPCVQICPVKALTKREDGIVDFDADRCIGCKACLNACPYDALYIDPQSNTAHKCNFCAHRVDTGMKPACEVVCPTKAIVSGDLNDPVSEISRLLAVVPAQVRAPEQGTGPNVFYLGADEASLDPLQVGGGDGYLYSEVPDSQREKLAPLTEEATATAMHDIGHSAPWGWRVSSYFLSKGIAAGAMMLAALLLVVGVDSSALGDVVPGLLALAGIAVTGLFLVWDLKQPKRAIYLFTRPQWRSWLALGAQCINVAAVVAFAFTVAALLGADSVRDALAWAMIPAGALLAGYTAFLFNQCEGRDLWQSPLLLPHTLVNAAVAGAGALGIVALFVDAPSAATRALAWALLAAAACSAIIGALDIFGRHQTKQAERAATNLWRDLYARRFWAGVVAATVLPCVLAAVYLVAGGALVLAAGGLVALVGLWLYEDAWVRAGQSVPLS